MEIKTIVKILGFIILIYAVNIFADDKVDDHTIKNKITTWMNDNNIPGLAVEVHTKNESHSYYFGLADKDKKIPVTSKTLFEFGSFDELLTALVLAEEVAANKVSLNDSLAKYTIDLAISSDHLADISLLNLATHTTSLPMNVEKDMTFRSDLPEYFSNWTPSSPIGSTWTDSTINFGLLGYALETVTHENMMQLYKNRLLRPLRMNSGSSKDIEENYAQGYTEEDQAIRFSNNNLFPSEDMIKVSGNDMLKFLKASLQLPGSPTVILNAMRMTQTAYVKTEKLSQGLGWTIHSIDDIKTDDSLNTKLQAKILDINNQTFDANVLIDKVGETEGFSSYIVFIPARKSGVVILANRYISNNEIIKMGRDILFDIQN